MSKFKKLLIASLLALTVVVVLQNTETVETRVLFVTIGMPRAALLFVTLVVGIILGLIWGSRRPSRDSQKK